MYAEFIYKGFCVLEVFCSFLVSARKERKEAAIGKALYAELPLVKSALPYVPIPAASPLVRIILT